MAETVIGKNSIMMMLESGKSINQILISSSSKKDSKINQIIHLCNVNRVKYQFFPKRKLDELSNSSLHQGVIALIPPRKYFDVEDLLEEAVMKNEEPFLVILDCIEDPHNLGAIIRSAVAAGVHGIIIPERRSVQVNETVAKVSAGALEFCKVARVTNIASTVNWLKEKGLWIYGADHHATQTYNDVDFKGPIAIIMGNESKGMSRLVTQTCDFLVKIPMVGPVESLDVSVSAALLVFKALDQRLK
jgi:23S rRNA (guanosine2251-2'-O)-methyltransferase